MKLYTATDLEVDILKHEGIKVRLPFPDVRFTSLYSEIHPKPIDVPDPYPVLNQRLNEVLTGLHGNVMPVPDKDPNPEDGMSLYSLAVEIRNGKKVPVAKYIGGYKTRDEALIDADSFKAKVGYAVDHETKLVLCFTDKIMAEAANAAAEPVKGD
jgi:hypothetical protein